MPVLVDFHAQWCGPCKRLAPMIEDLSEQYAGRLTVAAIDVDHNPVTPRRFNIRGVPTVMLFHQGKLIRTFSGLQNRSEYTAAVDSLLESSGTAS